MQEPVATDALVGEAKADVTKEGLVVGNCIPPQWEASKKGGAPSKITKVLEVTKQILDCNSKPGSKVAHAHQHASGARSSAKRCGSGENEVVVEPQSLLITPACMWEENPQLQTQMCRSKFYDRGAQDSCILLNIAWAKAHRRVHTL